MPAVAASPAKRGDTFIGRGTCSSAYSGGTDLGKWVFTYGSHRRVAIDHSRSPSQETAVGCTRYLI